LFFGKLGGEFIPQLQEGDFAFHCILPMGSSLSQSVETSMQAERLLMEFPEVIMVVGKTGSAEVPTDPMPPEATDMMIILKPMEEWTTTHDYKELATLMEEKLQVIPGIFFETNQPIQMRFNELMTGIRQDVAVKIFGENIDTLAALAPKVGAVIQTVTGTTAPQVERTIGLPQITIEYDRSRLANYGVSVEDVNHTVSTAFAGEKAGVVFENERKFDLVVRLDSVHRASFEDVGEMLVPTPSGNQIPLSQVATVSFKQGPAQISRDDGKRRIVVGFNVKDRDVQTVVKEIRQKLDAQVKLPAGYYYTFGGTFENLEKANARLAIAVPMALFLIFVLLYFTFNSFKQAALIYTAIPMSAIGGVFALLLRDMPFSISAGVGFIALFGVAVLNGIVLIATFNQLKNDGMDDIIERVLEGTKIRLRPVLMTATVASLGFLPMAISTGAGAEVQKPLATVVIGGLITATFLTLVVLPLLYIIFTRGAKPKKKRRGADILPVAGVLLVLVGFCQTAVSQTSTRIPLDQAFQTALQNNIALQANRLEIEKSKVLTKSWFDLPKTGVFIENEDLSPVDKKGILKIGLSQAVEAPGVYKARRELLNRQLGLSETNVTITQAEIRRDVSAAYYQLWYVEEKKQLYISLDSLYTNLAEAAALRVKSGEAPGLEKIAAEVRLAEVKMQMRQLESDILIGQQDLMRSLNVTEAFLPELRPLEKMTVSQSAVFVTNHPLLLRQQQQISVAESGRRLQQKSLLPELSGRVFSQRLYGVADPISGFSLSLDLPIVGKSFKTRIEAAKVEVTLQQKLLELETLQLQTTGSQARQELLKSEESLRFYETTGLLQANEIIEAATLGFRSGDISFADLSLFLTQAIGIRQNYLDALNGYNQAVIQYNYFINQ
jgi:cobalt-zinc-cadmium resistance protein CzcA